MRTVSIEAFQYGELSEDARAKARDWYREVSIGDDFWQEYPLQAIADAGTMAGITFDKARGQSRPAIYFSGFWSQGDGCSYDGAWRASDCSADKVAEEFTGDGACNVELRRIARELAAIAAKYPEAWAQCSTSHRGHSLSVDCNMGYLPADIGDEDEERIAAWEDAFPADDLAQLLRDFADWGYRLLESEYEYQNSDEQVAETIIANEYEFTADGERI